MSSERKRPSRREELVLLLEPLAELAVLRVVVRDLVDEEQGQRLDRGRHDAAALLELELQLLLEVALDRLADHEPLVLLASRHRCRRPRGRDDRC